MISEGVIAVLNIYIDEDLDEWRSYMPVYPEEWYNGFDPDVASIVTNDTDETTRTLRRADVGAYPQSRKYIFSVNLKF